MWNKKNSGIPDFVIINVNKLYNTKYQHNVKIIFKKWVAQPFF
jgi:hypothetical protein